MILYLTRKIGTLEHLAIQDPNYWTGKEINCNMKRIKNLSLGIIGLGRIGGSIARKFLPFSRNIGFFDPYIPNGYEKVYGITRYQNIPDLLKVSDIISINTPLTEETRGLINQNFLNQIRKGSYLINLSRGPIVENKDLILNSLLSHHLEGYGTDVWTEEPPLKDDRLNIAWKKNDHNLKGRLIVNPHTAYYSNEALEESRSKACITCQKIINGEQINNRIV